MSPADRPSLGIDVGGTTLRVGVVEGREVVWQHRHAARLSEQVHGVDPARALSLVHEALSEVIRLGLAEARSATSVGIAMPGFLEPSGRLVRSPNLPGLEDVDLASPLEARFHLPVVLENDALAAAWGEYVLHPARPESLLYVGLGTGVGGGLIVEAAPYRGRHGFAMEIGHVILEPGGRLCGCGNRGCLERYASATAVVETYREKTGRSLESVEIARLAGGGDADARAALDLAGTALGRAVAHAVKMLDVTEIVIGGGLSGAWDLLERGFEGRLEADLLPVLRGRTRVRVSTAKDLAGMLGAALLGARRLAEEGT